MRLRRPCEHDRYDDHSVYVTGFPAVDCPGGEFLPEDAKVWWCEALGEAWDLELHNEKPCDVALRRYGVGGVTDDQEHAACGFRVFADQVGEPG